MIKDEKRIKEDSKGGYERIIRILCVCFSVAFTGLGICHCHLFNRIDGKGLYRWREKIEHE